MFNFCSRQNLFLFFRTSRLMIPSSSELNVKKVFYILHNSFNFYMLIKGSKFLVLKKTYVNSVLKRVKGT